MEYASFARKTGLAAAGIGLALLLAACFIIPGKFDSTLDLRKDGHFSFTYKGDIYLLGLAQLAKMANKAENKFEPYECYDDDYVEQRDCTAEEIAQQREDWEYGQQSKREEDEKNAKMMSMVFGGIDPSDPAAAEEIAARMRRQKGWNKVEYKGDGLYDVDFSIESTLSHDFMFPSFEGIMLYNGFVLANPRDGGAVRIDAPGFAVQQNAGSSSTGLLALGAALDDDDELPKWIPELDGTFTIVTDGEILANNTDEGPQAAPGGRKLSWKVSKRTSTPPMALIRIDD